MAQRTDPGAAGIDMGELRGDGGHDRKRYGAPTRTVTPLLPAATAPAHAQAVVAICPASAAGLRQGLTSGRLNFAADVSAVDVLLDAHDLYGAVQSLQVPLLLLHAEGDEQVPVEQSRELAAAMRDPESRLIVVPGGHHRSIQHDHELQAVSLRFIER